LIGDECRITHGTRSQAGLRACRLRIHRPTVAGAAAALRLPARTAFPFHPPDSEMRPFGGHLRCGFYLALLYS